MKSDVVAFIVLVPVGRNPIEFGIADPDVERPTGVIQGPDPDAEIMLPVTIAVP